MENLPKRSGPCRGITRVEARPTLVFVTVGTASRVSWLANDKVHSVLRDIWFEADRWETGVYVLMAELLFSSYDPVVRKRGSKARLYSTESGPTRPCTEGRRLAVSRRDFSVQRVALNQW